MLFLIILALMSSSNLAAVLDPPFFRFLTELVTNILRWRWVVLIEERSEEIHPLLVEYLLEKNVSVTLLTSDVTSAIQMFLRHYDTVPAILLFSPMIEDRPFLYDTCRIHWVIVMPDSSTHTFLAEPNQYLKRLPIVLAVPQADDVYSLQMPMEGISDISEVNSWHPELGFKSSNALRMCSPRPKRRMRVAMEKHFPFYKPGNRTHPPSGSDINLLDSLAASLKFKYIIKRPPDGTWGGKNGTEWTGMIRMLLDNEVDAALSGVSVNFERQNTVQFSIPYAFDKLTFVTRKPAGKLKTWAIFWPYTAEVWASVATLIITIAMLLTWLQTRLKKRKQRHLRFQDSLLYIFMSTLNQGYYNAREPRCRVLMSFWWGFCITLIAGYNGSLMSFMAHPGLSPALDTIFKLVEAVQKGDIVVGTIKNSADYAVFRDSEEEGLQLILKSMDSDPQNLVRHDSDGLLQTLLRNYAYVGGWLTVQADVWDPSLFLFAKDSFLLNGYAIAFSPGFDHVDLFNQKILQLREAGLIQKWIMGMIERNQHRGNVNEGLETEESEEHGDVSAHVMKVEDVQGAFVVLLIGLFLGFGCFATENFVYWCKRRKRTKNGLRRWK